LGAARTQIHAGAREATRNNLQGEPRTEPSGLGTLRAQLEA